MGATDATAGVGTSEPFAFGGRDIRVVDLSQRLTMATAAHEPMPHEIEHVDHAASVPRVQAQWGVDASHWRDGLAWAYERVTLMTHSGTHVDAPYHYAPTTAEGAPARRMPDVPLRWFMGDGVVLELMHVDREAGITEHDVRTELERIGHELRPHDVVLVRTDVSRRFDEPGYDLLHPGLRRDATAYLVGCGVKLIGIDAWGIDRPLDLMAAEALAGDTAQLWESHKFGAEQEYCQIEKLSGLDALPAPTGFQVLALPVSLDAGSGAWSRVVALVPEALYGS